FFFSSRRRHTRFSRDWSSDVCSSDLVYIHPVTINTASRKGDGTLSALAPNPARYVIVTAPGLSLVTGHVSFTTILREDVSTQYSELERVCSLSSSSWYLIVTLCRGPFGSVIVSHRGK